MAMNQLEYRSDFDHILSNYQLSEQAKEILARLRLVLLAGPTASGRNTIIDQLIKTGNYKYIVSDTTRAPRINNGVPEKDGVNYFFKTETEFLSELKKGEFLEAEVIHDRQVSGISIRELSKAEKSGKIAITEIEIGGFSNILDRKADTIGILVLPPSFDVWIARIKARSVMETDEFISRLNTGLRIFSEALTDNRMSIVVNDNLTKAVAEVEAIVNGHNETNTTAGLDLVKDLINKTKEYLAANS